MHAFIHSLARFKPTHLTRNFASPVALARVRRARPPPRASARRARALGALARVVARAAPPVIAVVVVAM